MTDFLKDFKVTREMVKNALDNMAAGRPCPHVYDITKEQIHEAGRKAMADHNRREALAKV